MLCAPTPKPKKKPRIGSRTRKKRYPPTSSSEPKNKTTMPVIISAKKESLVIRVSHHVHSSCLDPDQRLSRGSEPLVDVVRDAATPVDERAHEGSLLALSP